MEPSNHVGSNPSHNSALVVMDKPHEYWDKPPSNCSILSSMLGAVKNQLSIVTKCYFLESLASFVSYQAHLRGGEKEPLAKQLGLDLQLSKGGETEPL